MSALERNVAALMARSWRPELPTAEFRARVEALLLERLPGAARGLRTAARSTSATLDASPLATSATPDASLRATSATPDASPRATSATPDASPLGRGRRLAALALAAGILLLGAAAWIGWLVQQAGPGPDGAPGAGRNGAPVAHGNDPDPAGAQTPPPELASGEGVGAPEREAVPEEAPVEPGPAQNERVASLRGRVIESASGQPIERYRLVIQRLGALYEPVEPVLHDVQDPQGGFSVEGLAPDRYRVFALADGLAVRSQSVEVGPDQPELVLTLETGATVRGVVRDAATGEPVEGALVLSENDAPGNLLPLSPLGLEAPLERFARAGADGAFELPHLAPGRQVLRVLHEGHAAARTEPFVIEPGEERAGLEIALSVGGGIAGNVQDEQGLALEGQVIIASSTETGEEQRLSFGMGISDAEGRYAIRDLPAGMYVVLRIGQGESGVESKALNVRMVKVEPPSVRTVDFAPRRAAGLRFSGRALDGRGAPASGITVSLQSLADPSFTGWTSVACGADGTFAFHGVKPGRYLVAAGAGPNGEFSVVDELEITGPEPLWREIFLPIGALAGRVLDAAGGPVPGAMLVLEEIEPSAAAERFAAMIFADGSGRFTMSFLAPGSYRATAIDPSSALGFESQEPVWVRAGEPGAEIEIRLERGAGLAVQVQDRLGRPVAGATLALRRAGRDRQLGPEEPVTGPDGRWRMDGMTAGRWEVAAYKDGHDCEYQTAELAPGETTDVNLTLEMP